VKGEAISGISRESLMRTCGVLLLLTMLLMSAVDAGKQLLPTPESGTVADKLIKATLIRTWKKDGSCSKTHVQWMESLKPETCSALKVYDPGAWMVAVEDALEQLGITELEWRSTTSRMMDPLGATGSASARVDKHYATVELGDRRLILLAVQGSGVVAERMTDLGE